MTRLYLTPLPDSQATTSDDGIRAQIQQSGLLEEGGTATEKIASENIDLVINGKFDFGARFSRKVADELESLGESRYSGLPVYDLGAVDSGRNSGYYEVESVDVSPSHPVNADAYEYEVSFTATGTREEHWRSLDTNEESISTGLATGSGSLVGIPDDAVKVRWYSESTGKEAASRDSVVVGEFGRVALYDPTSTSITNPMLLYETPYESESPVDVRVYDDRDRAKYYAVDSDGSVVSSDTHVGSATVGGTKIRASQWTHAYHTAYEYEGNPVVDNGLLRVRFDESGGVVEAYEWDTDEYVWSQLAVNHGNYELIDADFEKISPVDVRVFTEWYETSADRLEQATISVQRGLNRAIARYPPNTTQTSDLENVLAGFVGDYSTDVKPDQGLEARGEVK